MIDATPASPPRRWPSAIVVAAYLLLAFGAAWPLAADLGGLLPGDPSGDTGIYVWNLWIFRHELLAHNHLPLWTDHILAPGPPIDLALHNYTIFQNLLGLVLVPWLGLVAAFNVIWISMQALSGYAVFLLARRATARDAIAFLAGILFAFSPTLIARSTAHQSLVAAAPLAFFLLFVLRAAERRTLADAALAGACAAWAGMCDAYYGVYCLALLVVVAVVRVMEFEPFETPRGRRALSTLLTALTIVPIAIIILILVSGGLRMDLFGFTVRARTLYTPVLVLTALVLVRVAVALHRRGTWRIDLVPDRRRLVQALVGTVVCVALLAPLVNAARARVASGGSLQRTTLWRSSPPGVDLAWFFVPNPNHPLAPSALREFVTTRPDSFAENVASIPYVAIVVIGFALLRGPGPRTFLWLAAVFALLAIGPFVTVAQVNTHIPGPWAVLRYVPVLGAARMPTRFFIPALMAIAVLFAWALDRVARRRLFLAIAAAAVAFELWPVPRVVASARVPAVYSRIAADPDDVTVLEIPFGIWDGTSQRGFANIATAYYQTTHEKRRAGGYLSRVPRVRLREQLSYPSVRLLTQLSAGEGVEPNLAEAAREDAAYFVRRANLRYVIIDRRLASPELRATAVDILRLQLVETADGLELYRTGF